MNDTVPVPKQILSDMYERLADAKAKVALMANTDVKTISDDIDYGLYLVGEHIIDDLTSVQNIITSIKEPEQ